MSHRQLIDPVEFYKRLPPAEDIALGGWWAGLAVLVGLVVAYWRMT